MGYETNVDGIVTKINIIQQEIGSFQLFSDYTSELLATTYEQQGKKTVPPKKATIKASYVYLFTKHVTKTTASATEMLLLHSLVPSKEWKI